MTISHKMSWEELISHIPNNVEVVDKCLFGFVHISQDHHSTFSITFKDFGYNFLNHFQLVLSGLTMVAPRFEVHINKVCRAINACIVKHLDMEQPMYSMGYFIGGLLHLDRMSA